MTIVLKPGELVLSSVADQKEWLAARRTGIGASEIAAAAGLSRRRSAVEVWDSKINATEFESTDEMRWGSFIEGRIIDWWAAETGRTVGNGGLFRHPVHRWLLATPDAVVLEPEHGMLVRPGEDPPDGVADAKIWACTATVDAKNQGWHTAEEWEDGAPVDYLAQITQQMLAVGVRKGFLVVTLGGKPPVHREIDLDEEFAQMLIDAGARLWEHVTDGTPPPLDGSKSAHRYLARRYPDIEPGYFADLDDTDVQKVKEFVHIKESMATLKTLAAEIEHQICDKLGRAAVGTYNGQTIVTWKKTERVGYTVKPTEYRKFHVPAAAKKGLNDGNSG